jgi:hypothetical protein
MGMPQLQRNTPNQISINHILPNQRSKTNVEDKTVKIDDPAYSIDVSGGKEHAKRSKHAIYANPETPFKTIIEVLRNYLLAFYMSEENSLKVDICFE